MKTQTLSDKIVKEVNWSKGYIYRDDVKEAVKKLKLELFNFGHFDWQGNEIDDVNKTIDEIFGDKLI